MMLRACLGMFLVSVVMAAPPEVLSIRGNRKLEDFAGAKRVARQVFQGSERTLYCGCRYYGKELNLNSCGIHAPGKKSKRLRKLEWEHVVPAAKFGQALESWKTGADVCVKDGKKKRGRKCAEKASPLFRQMEADLHNLWPESGEINRARSDKPPVEAVSGDVTSYGPCATRVGKKSFEPRPEARGPVARAYLYMNWAYDVALSADEKELFNKWDKAHPPSEFECERDKRIRKLQGNSNPFLEKACAKS